MIECCKCHQKEEKERRISDWICLLGLYWNEPKSNKQYEEV